MSWTNQSDTTEPWSRVRSDETDWDGGSTLWDVGVGGLVRTVWDAGLNGISWSEQSSTTETWA